MDGDKPEKRSGQGYPPRSRQAPAKPRKPIHPYKPLTQLKTPSESPTGGERGKGRKMGNERVFLVLTGNYKGQFGVLIGPINYAGAINGWHVLYMADGHEILCAGEELREIKKGKTP